MLRTDHLIRPVKGVVVGILVFFVLLLARGDEGKELEPAKAYALLVGVRSFDHVRLPSLQFTENDVEKLAEALDQPGSPFHRRVRVLTCTRGAKNPADRPTAVNIRAELRTLTGKRTKHETVLVALASHGVELVVPPPEGKPRGGLTRPEADSSAETKDRIYPFFCPTDADLVGTDYHTGQNERLINLDGLIGDLGKCGAGTKLLLMDACREHTKAPAVVRSLSVKYTSVPEGVAAMFSCRSGQYAYESAELKHGVFFHFVLKGLRGEAKDRATGRVSWGRLSEYVVEAMETDAKTYTGGKAQNPHRIANLVGSPLLARLSKSPLDKEGGRPEKSEISPPYRKSRTSASGIQNSIGMLLMPIAPGKFHMGSPSGGIGKKDEKQHEVEIKDGILMGACEVTQDEYQQVMGSNPSAHCLGGLRESAIKGMDTRNFPVEGVAWTDAVKFCDTLSARRAEESAKRSYRLPTEAEWEYACREGKSSATLFHFGTSLSRLQANFDCRIAFAGVEAAQHLDRPCPVGSYTDNVFGLYDMHGNVREWCSDWYEKDYHASGSAVNPTGPTEGRFRVVRGGSWYENGSSCRSTCRGMFEPGKGNDYTGFRVVCVIKK